MPPVIGITAYLEQARYTVWDTRVALLPRAYLAQLAHAGGVGVLLPPLTGAGAAAAAATLAGRLDGLILSGGADIEPARYGAPAEEATGGLRPDRDASELALLAAALAAGRPVLGICRGMQLLAVAAGGTLHQHLPDVVGHAGHRPVLGGFGTHPVRITKGSRLHAILGAEVDVPTHHHQAVAKPGSLAVTAWAADGTAEAVEDPDRPFLLGVQWHPEEGRDPRLFEAFVAACR